MKEEETDMFRKKSKKPVVALVVIAVISIALAIVGVVALPIPSEYRQAAFWLILCVLSIGAGAIVKFRGRKGM